MPERSDLTVLVPSFMKKEVSRRLFLGGMVGAGASLALAACAPGTGGGSGGGGTLNLYTWGEYDDPDVLKSFTKDTGGPTVKLGSYDSNEELIAKLNSSKGTSGYDIVVPTIGFIPQMVQLKLLEKLDKSKLPNIKNVDPAYLDTDLDKGNNYSVPKAVGVSGYLYDSTVIKRELTSWADFFDAAQKEAAGATSMLGDPNEILWAYFFSIGEDINTNDETKLNAARDFLVKNIAPNVQAFESYVSATIAQNGRVLAHSWNGDARQGMLSNPDPERYKWVKPSEGAGQFVDNWCIPVGSKNIDAAHDFINYVLDPEISLRELEYIGYNTCVRGIEEAAGNVELPELIFYTPQETEKLVFDIVPESQEKRVAIFNELTAAAG